MQVIIPVGAQFRSTSYKAFNSFQFLMQISQYVSNQQVFVSGPCWAFTEERWERSIFIFDIVQRITKGEQPGGL